MNRKILTLSSMLLLQAWAVQYSAPAHAAGVIFQDETSVQFTVNAQALGEGRVQLAAEMGSPQSVSPSWPGEVDPNGYTKLADGQTLVVKAAYLVKRSLDEINDPRYFSQENYPKVFPQIEILETTAAGWRVQSPVPPIPFGLLPPTIQCTLRLHHASRPQPTALDRGLGAPKAETVQSCVDFNMLFEGSTQVMRYYPVDRKTTLVVSYQTFAVLQRALNKASWIPRFNLRKRLIQKVRDEISVSVESQSRVAAEHAAAPSLLPNFLDSLKELLSAVSLGSLGVVRAETLEEAEKYTAHELENYRQSRYKLVDPAGDLALLRRSQLVPKRIFEKLLHKREKDKDIDHREEYEIEPAADPNGPEAGLPADAAQVQGRENPIRLGGFVRMMVEVINEERLSNGIEPSYGTPHQWSREFLDKYSSPMLASSKLLMALAVGDTQKFLRTDREEALYDWMIAQPNTSILPPALFRKSYQLNRGDVYLTLLTIENVLAHNWRYEDRETYPLTKRLHPIASGYEYRGDRFGTWYHLFGILLYGYVEGGAKANFVGRVEALGSRMLSSEPKMQKAWINRVGGPIGGALAKVIRAKSYLWAPLDPQALTEDAYLNRQEDFRDRLPVELDPQLEAYIDALGDGSSDRTFIWIRSTASREWTDCTVEVMPDFGRGLNSSLRETVKNVTLGNDLESIQIFLPQVRRVRGFVQCPGVEKGMAFEAVAAGR